jgi:hypothetical protein
MASEADRIAFLLEDPKRLRIAEWCASSPCSHGELAERLGEDYGALSAPRTMGLPRWKALIRAGKGGPRNAQLYRLSKTWNSAVVAARQELNRQTSAQVEGILNQADLLMIRLAGVKGACRALQAERSEIRWAAGVQGEGVGLMLCVSRDDQSRATMRLISRLGDEGVEPVRISIDAPMSSEALASWARDVLDDGASHEALPRGG